MRSEPDRSTSFVGRAVAASGVSRALQNHVLDRYAIYTTLAWINAVPTGTLDLNDYDYGNALLRQIKDPDGSMLRELFGWKENKNSRKLLNALRALQGSQKIPMSAPDAEWVKAAMEFYGFDLDTLNRAKREQAEVAQAARQAAKIENALRSMGASDDPYMRRYVASLSDKALVKFIEIMAAPTDFVQVLPYELAERLTTWYQYIHYFADSLKLGTFYQKIVKRYTINDIVVAAPIWHYAKWLTDEKANDATEDSTNALFE